MAYIGRQQDGFGVRSRFIYTATGGQTTFNTDDSGNALSYADGAYVDVYLNGVLLDPADYTDTSLTSIVLDSGATASDILEVIVYDVFSVFSGTFTNGITASEATVTGDLTVDTNTLYVDSTNNRVGIGTTSPDAKMSIEQSATGNFDSIILSRTTGNVGDAQNIVWQQNDLSNLKAVSISGVVTGADAGALTINTATGGSLAERMRIDSSGNLFSSKTSASRTTVGHELHADGFTRHVVDGDKILEIVRKSSDGEMLEFFKDSTQVGAWRSRSGVVSSVILDPRDPGVGITGTTRSIQPTTYLGAPSDNLVDLGDGSTRYDDIFATNGTINTSDKNEKQQIASLTNAEITAAKAISKLFKTFKWNDSVEEKGNNARTHTGHIAQEVQQAMTDAGLDATKYAFFCSDTWWETNTEVSAVEADEENGIEAVKAHTWREVFKTAEEAPEGATEKTRLGIRYPELLAFIGAATEQRLTNIEARLTALENT